MQTSEGGPAFAWFTWRADKRGEPHLCLNFVGRLRLHRLCADRAAPFAAGAFAVSPLFNAVAMLPTRHACCLQRAGWRLRVVQPLPGTGSPGAQEPGGSALRGGCGGARRTIAGYGLPALKLGFTICLQHALPRAGAVPVAPRAARDIPPRRAAWPAVLPARHQPSRGAGHAGCESCGNLLHLALVGPAAISLLPASLATPAVFTSALPRPHGPQVVTELSLKLQAAVPDYRQWRHLLADALDLPLSGAWQACWGPVG